MTAIQAALAEHGYKLRCDKNKVHCPAAAGNPQLAADLAAEVADFAQYCGEGLPLLGKAAAGEDYTVISAAGPLAVPKPAQSL